MASTPRRIGAGEESETMSLIVFVDLPMEMGQWTSPSERISEPSTPLKVDIADSESGSFRRSLNPRRIIEICAPESRRA
jgi:hypothetical protein